MKFETFLCSEFLKDPGRRQGGGGWEKEGKEGLSFKNYFFLPLKCLIRIVNTLLSPPGEPSLERRKNSKTRTLSCEKEKSNEAKTGKIFAKIFAAFPGFFPPKKEVAVELTQLLKAAADRRRRQLKAEKLRLWESDGGHRRSRS